MKKLFLLAVLAATSYTTIAQTKSESEVDASSSEVFTYVEQMPEAPYNVKKYIAKNLQTPTDTVIDGGSVYVKFVVHADGKLTDITTAGTRRLPASYEQAAINVVKSMPPWKPARQNGRAVNAYYTLPIVFKTK